MSKCACHGVEMHYKFICAIDGNPAGEDMYGIDDFPIDLGDC